MSCTPSPDPHSWDSALGQGQLPQEPVASCGQSTAQSWSIEEQRNVLENWGPASLTRFTSSGVCSESTFSERTFSGQLAAPPWQHPFHLPVPTLCPRCVTSCILYLKSLFTVLLPWGGQGLLSSLFIVMLQHQDLCWHTGRAQWTQYWLNHY